jgi:hypothetical protein
MQTTGVVSLVGNTIFQIPLQLLAAMLPLVQSLPGSLYQQTHWNKMQWNVLTVTLFNSWVTEQNYVNCTVEKLRTTIK